MWHLPFLHLSWNRVKVKTSLFVLATSGVTVNVVFTATISSVGLSVSTNLKAFDSFSVKCRLAAVTSVSSFPVE